MNAAQALAHRLVDHGVDAIFGLPGEENLAFVEAVANTSIELVVVRHEQHAAFMAATHGRLTGRPGVCLATLGPGALNLFTGLAHAHLGGMALIAITGQKPRRDNDEGSFQVVDVVAAAKPITTWATSIGDPNAVVPTLDAAFNRATTGRPGPVLIELPEDVAAESVEPHNHSVMETPPTEASSDAIVAAARLIDAAESPLVLASSGANQPRAAKALVDFAERTGVGVVVTQMGKGAFPESHPQSLRALGIHRPDYAHLAVKPSDVVVTVGYQPVEHPPLVWNPDQDKTIVHLASWPAAVERGYAPQLQLIGNVARTLETLAATVSPRDPDGVAAKRRTIVDLLEAERADEVWPVSPLAVVRSVQRVMGPDDIVTLDNGAYKIWFARHYRTERPNTLLLDNALATMGAGLATAMAAARLEPERRVLAVCGDGGFLMNVQELETATRLGLNLVVLVVRDDAYGFIAWHQDEQNRPKDGVQLTNPDMTSLAGAFGASAHQVDEDTTLDAALSASFSEPGVSVIDCPIDYAINEKLGENLYEQARKAHSHS